MKKLVLVMLAGLLALGLTACGESGGGRKTHCCDDETHLSDADHDAAVCEQKVDGYREWVSTLPTSVAERFDENVLQQLYQQTVRQAQYDAQQAQNNAVQAHNDAMQAHNQAHNDAMQAHNQAHNDAMQAHNDAMMLQQQAMMPMM